MLTPLSILSLILYCISAEPLPHALGALTVATPDMGQITVSVPLAEIYDAKDATGTGLVPAAGVEYFVFYSELGNGVNVDAPCGMLYQVRLITQNLETN